MPIATSDGKVYENRFMELIGEPMDQSQEEDESRNKFLPIIGPESSQEDTADEMEFSSQSRRPESIQELNRRIMTPDVNRESKGDKKPVDYPEQSVGKGDKLGTLPAEGVSSIQDGRVRFLGWLDSVIAKGEPVTTDEMVIWVNELIGLGAMARGLNQGKPGGNPSQVPRKRVDRLES